MKLKPHPATEHRLARLVAWSAALLVWLIGGAAASTRSQQRRRQRHGSRTVAMLTRLVRLLIIVRAAQLLRPRPHRARQRHAARGFKQIRRTRAGLRAIGGVWLRHKLALRGSRTEQLTQLLECLRKYRALGAELARRRRKRLTRRTPILISRPPATCMRTLAAAPPCAADTS